MAETNNATSIESLFARTCGAALEVDVFEFLSQFPMASLKEQVAVLHADQSRSWLNGRGRMVEEYLNRLPALKSHPDFVAQLAAEEFGYREQLGHGPNLNEYIQRFPGCTEPLRALLETFSQASVDTSQKSDEVPATGDELRVPTAFGRYWIEQEIGKGAMGRVYLAEDTQLGRKVALKIPKRSSLEDREALERFYREAHTAATLQHPNLCPVYDVGKIEGTHYLTMAYIPGKPVSSFLARGKVPGPRQVALLIRKIALAVAEAHRVGVVHRDLKPSNVMLDNRGEPIVMDFGLARHVNTVENARLTQTGAILGTPAYMSPEQVRGDAHLIGPACDIYALGVMMYQLLTGVLPFNGPIMMVLNRIVAETPKMPAEVLPSVDPVLSVICMKMMAKDVSNRYASMRDVAVALTEFLKTGAVAGIDPVETFMAASVSIPDEFEGLPPAPAIVEEQRKPRRKQPAEVYRAPTEREILLAATTMLWSLARKYWALVTLAGGIIVVLVIAVIAGLATAMSSRPAITNHPNRSKDSSGPVAAHPDADLPPVDQEANRALAEWILNRQGSASVVRTGGGWFEVENLNQLVGPGFSVYLVNLKQKKLGPQNWATSTEPISSEGWDHLSRCRVDYLYLPPVPLLPSDIALLARCTSLSQLFLEDTGLTDDDLGNLLTLKRLTKLDLSRTNVTNAGIPQLRAFAELNTLHLDGLRLTDDSLKLLSLPKLHTLSLSGVAISDPAIESLECPLLKDINLNATGITDATVERLAKSQLEAIRLAGTAITDRSLDLLENCAQLKYVDVRAKGASPERVRKFASDHPSCEVYFWDEGEDRALKGSALQTHSLPRITTSRPLITIAPPPPPDYAAERAAAEWVLGNAGGVMVQINNAAGKYVTQLSDLPKENFLLTWVTIGMSGSSPVAPEGWQLLKKSGVSALTIPPMPLIQ